MKPTQDRKDFGPLFWFHLGLIIISYSSPFWLDWRIVIAGVVGIYLYYLLIGNCFITVWELGDEEDTTFVGHYLQKIFPHIDQRKVKFFLRNVLPGLIGLAAIFLQMGFGYMPVIIF